MVHLPKELLSFPRSKGWASGQASRAVRCQRPWPHVLRRSATLDDLPSKTPLPPVIQLTGSLPPCLPSGRSGRMPPESLDAPEDLPKESRRQVAFGQLSDEVPGMSDEAPAGLEEPLLEARQGPAVDRAGQSDKGNCRLRPVRGSVRCRWISALSPRRSSNSRGNSSPASEVTVAPRNSTRRWGLNERRTGPDFASPTGWCPAYQRGTPRTRISCGRRVIMYPGPVLRRGLAPGPASGRQPRRGDPAHGRHESRPHRDRAWGLLSTLGLPRAIGPYRKSRLTRD